MSDSVQAENRPAAGAAEETGALVAAARGGDRAAFGELYARYAGMVHAVAISRVPPDQAADVVQDAFLRALRNLSSLREPKAFGGWLAAITRRAAADALERGTNDAGEAPEPPTASTQHEEMEARAALFAIRSLPAAYRETLAMRLVQGMTGPEIAARTGLTPASVRVNLHRGMKMLRDRLDRRVAKGRR